MNLNQIIKNMANGNRDDSDTMELAMAVARQSDRGEWYDGPNSTNIFDWITDNDFTGDETVESLAAEWDE